MHPDEKDRAYIEAEALVREPVAPELPGTARSMWMWRQLLAAAERMDQSTAANAADRAAAFRAQAKEALQHAEHFVRAAIRRAHDDQGFDEAEAALDSLAEGMEVASLRHELARLRAAHMQDAARSQDIADATIHRVKRRRTLGLSAFALALVAIIAATYYTQRVIPLNDYNKGIRQLNSGAYMDAVVSFDAFLAAHDVNDQLLAQRFPNEQKSSGELRLKAWYLHAQQLEATDPMAAAHAYHMANGYLNAAYLAKKIYFSQAEQALNAGDPAGAARLYARAGEYQDGLETAYRIRRDALKQYRIAAGGMHSVAVKADGTVLAAGDNREKQCDVQGWTDIVAVAAGYEHTLGLRADGTVVAAGKNDDGQLNVQEWTDIVAIAAGARFSVGLTKEGRVRVASDDPLLRDGMEKEWRDITDIACGMVHAVGLHNSGRLVTAGSNVDRQCNVIAWDHIIGIAAGNYHTLGLKPDGTAIATGYSDIRSIDLSSWQNIVRLAGFTSQTVGLTDSGSVLIWNTDSRHPVTTKLGWTNIVDIAAANKQYIGLDSAGRVFAGGNNAFGQGEVDTWLLWDEPAQL
ncbi:MAG: hypothetical protein ACOX63_02795 [Christensenellales bacterium]